MQLRSLLVLGLTGGLLTACASVAPPPPAATTFARQDCVATPSLAGALSLTPSKPRREHVVNAAVTAQTPCVQHNGKPTPYVVFALPSDHDDKMLSVGGLLEGARVFAPEVTLLDAQGQVTRTFDPSEYFYRGAVYSMQFRPRENEAFVLVTGDTARVGHEYRSIVTGMTTTPVITPVVAFNINSGTEAGQHRTFSYDGTVQVTIYDSDLEEAR